MGQISTPQSEGPVTAQRSAYTFAPRMAKTPKSFIREILKVTERPEIISSAGGLPRPALIDVDGIRIASDSVLRQDGRAAYLHRRDVMIRMLKEEFPETLSCTHPLGGMVIWVTLPAGCLSMEVFEETLKENVAILPGMPFYVDGGGTDTVRLNFSNSTDENIITGMSRLARVIQRRCSK